MKCRSYFSVVPYAAEPDNPADISARARNQDIVIVELADVPGGRHMLPFASIIAGRRAAPLRPFVLSLGDGAFLLQVVCLFETSKSNSGLPAEPSGGNAYGEEREAAKAIHVGSSLVTLATCHEHHSSFRLLAR